MNLYCISSRGDIPATCEINEVKWFSQSIEINSPSHHVSEIVTTGHLMQYQCGYLFCPIVFHTSYKKKEKSLAPFFDWKLKISKECKVERNPEDNLNLSKLRNIEIAQQLILKSRQI